MKRFKLLPKLGMGSFKHSPPMTKYALENAGDLASQEKHFDELLIGVKDGELEIANFANKITELDQLKLLLKKKPELHDYAMDIVT